MTTTTGTTTSTRTLTLRGPFDLARTAAFGFGPKEPSAFAGAYRMAFVRDDHTGSAGVTVRQPAADRLTVEIVSAGGADADPDAVADAVLAQTARILSVDVDSSGFVALAEVDEVLGPLVAAAPGLRPPLFSSAYEALAWAVLSARRPRAQMAALRSRLAHAAGTSFELTGEQLWAFPTPAALLAVESLPGLPEEKLRRLHGVARAALAGRLDTEGLRASPLEEAAEVARSLDGVGPFYAELMVVRALGHRDVAPQHEPRVRALLAQLLGRADPLEPDEFAAAVDRWRPWRTWACVHVRAVGGAGGDLA